MARSPRFLFLSLLPGLLAAAVWPEQFGAFKRVAAEPVATQSADRDIWEEYGLEEAESATYSGPRRTFRAQAWRFQDSTGALAAFQWLRPPVAGAFDPSKLFTDFPGGRLVASGNYVLRFEGHRPAAGDLASLVGALPGHRKTALPSVIQYLPGRDRIPGTERYVLGGASLGRFLPGLPEPAAGFQFNGEAQMAEFRTPSGNVKLAIFYYPTPAIARVQVNAFEKLSGVQAKRSGPLVGVVFSPADPALAATLLERVEYHAKVTFNERVPTRRDNVGDLIVNVFLLTGILLLVCLGGGLAVGGLRALSVRGGREPMTVLHIADRR